MTKDPVVCGTCRLPIKKHIPYEEDGFAGCLEAFRETRKGYQEVINKLGDEKYRLVEAAKAVVNKGMATRVDDLAKLAAVLKDIEGA